MLDERRLEQIGDVFKRLSDGGYQAEEGYKLQKLAFYAVSAIPELLGEIQRLKGVIESQRVCTTSAKPAVYVDRPSTLRRTGKTKRKQSAHT